MNEDLPHGWAWADFGAIAETQLGKMLSKKSTIGVRSRPYLRNQNVQWHRFDLSDVAEMDFTTEESSKYELRRGDLLVCEGGKVGRCAMWQSPPSEMHFQKALHRVRPRTDIHSKWLEYFLRWSAETGRFAPHTSGSTIRHLPQRDLRQLQVPVPPCAEQKRIVATIEAHFSCLDFVEAALAVARAKLQALRRSVLAAAFSGRLTNPTDTTNTDPGQLPGGWRLASIADVAEVHLGRQRSPRHHSGEQMRPYLRAANVTWDGISLEDVKTMNFDDADFDRFRLTRGDILLNEASGSPNEVGKPAVWDGEIKDCCFQNTLLRLRPRDLNRDYLYWYCYSSALSGRFGEAGRGVNIRHLGKRGLAQFPIPLGPRAEQEHVVAAIEESLSRLDAAEAALDAVRAKMAAFRRSVLAEAFAGRVVPQDPDNEPAIALLARIAAERPVRPTSRKGST